MQPHPMTSVMQWSVSIAALAVAACAVAFTVWTWREHRSADLVKIGVSVLRVDPEKEKQISAAREWALNLIDATAGGAKVSPEALERLLKEPLETGWYDLRYYDASASKARPAPPLSRTAEIVTSQNKL
jgi:hypothetical protein